MFDNIGKKIKIATYVAFALGSVASIVVGLVLVTNGEIWAFALVLGAPIFLWLSSFFAYGFGQLIENTDIIVRNMSKCGNSDVSTESKESAFVTKFEEIYSLKEKGLITEEEFAEKIRKARDEK